MTRKIVVEFKYAFVLSEYDGELDPLEESLVRSLILQIMADDIVRISLSEEDMSLRTVIRVEEE